MYSHGKESEALNYAILKALLDDVALRAVMCFSATNVNIARDAYEVKGLDPFLGWQLKAQATNLPVGKIWGITFCMWSARGACQQAIIDRLLEKLSGNDAETPTEGCGGDCYWDLSVPGWASKNTEFIQLRREDGFDKERDQRWQRLEVETTWLPSHCKGLDFTSCNPIQLV